ncbi:pancreatic triacylglycerol lipase-like [Uranotaenia lowii]|uniref:pancreatic triacylglycerol lipase-like n=1 Tax=Uranotaenia lowii TaxID=190385 RepID=UPI00247B0C63|nr:pancreatic triacylglycerol lipase-like [Uranotaenia lowii]
MKVLLVTLLAVALAAALPVEEVGMEHMPNEEIGSEHIPNEEEGLEHIPVDEELGEEHMPREASEQWSLVPDSNGHLHLVNTDPYGLNGQDEPAPMFDAATQTIFRLFTRQNRATGHVIQLGNAASLGQFWSPARQTRFIIHGWNNNGNSDVNVVIRNAYLDRADINVITVDWGVGAQNPNYVTSRNHIDAVGLTVARFIDFLNVQGLAFTNVYVVGHSLGGHTAGIAGKRVTRGLIQAVIALDPALPLFSMDRPAERVAPGDARYVEIIHTNAGLLGFDQPIGQASFYPNWGRSQPGCGVDLSGACAHGRAWEFFAESVRTAPSRFVSVQCANYGQIVNQNCVSSGPNRNMGGEPANIGTASGVYFLQTNAASPFARG